MESEERREKGKGRREGREERRERGGEEGNKEDVVIPVSIKLSQLSRWEGRPLLFFKFIQSSKPLWTRPNILITN